MTGCCAFLYHSIVEPAEKVSKKLKPLSQKGAFASIFKKANQREIAKTSPGRHKVSATAKVTAKTGKFTRLIPGLASDSKDR